MDKQDLTFGSGLGIPIAYMTCGVVIVGENVTLIYVIARNPFLHTTGCFFIMSLAVTDFIVGILSFISGLFRLPGIIPQSSLLTVQLVLSIGLINLSCVHMAVIAVERYLYISWPFFYQGHITTRAVNTVISLLWAGALLFTIILFIIQTQVVGLWPYTIHYMDDKLKAVAVFTVYMITVMVAFVSYVLILRVARNQRVKISDIQTIKKRKRFAKSVLFFLTVFGVFFAMTFNAVLSVFLDVFVKVPNIAFTITFPLLYLNSACNFTILVLLDKRFRYALKKTLRFEISGEHSLQ